MNEETITKLQEVFTPVAQKIGGGAEYGWEVVVTQQYVYAWLGVLWVVIGLFLMHITIKCASKSDNWYRDEWPILLVIVGGTFSSIAIIAGSITAITHFLNPHYYAIEFFINLVN